MASSLMRLAALANMPYGSARTQQTAEIVREIEREGPEHELPNALLRLVEAYDFGGDSKRALTTFVKVLQLWDTRPELFDAEDEFGLFWEFKWIAGSLTLFPNISRAQAEAFLDDMERRYQVAGKGLCAPRAARFHYLSNLNDPAAASALSIWRSTPPDEFDDCPACVIGAEVDYRVSQGDWARAVAVGERQNNECNIEPTLTNHLLTLAYLMQGDPTAAARCYRLANAGLKTSLSAEGFTGARGAVLEALGRGGALNELLSQLKKHDAEHLETAQTTFGSLRFHLGLLAGISALMNGGTDPNTETGLATPHFAKTLGDLHSHLKTVTQEMAERFDSRAGNDGNQRHLANALSATLSATPLPEPLASEDAMSETLAQLLLERKQTAAPETNTVSDRLAPAAEQIDVAAEFQKIASLIDESHEFSAAKAATIADMYVSLGGRLTAVDQELAAKSFTEGGLWFIRARDSVSAVTAFELAYSHLVLEHLPDDLLRLLMLFEFWINALTDLQSAAHWSQLEKYIVSFAQLCSFEADSLAQQTAALSKQSIDLHELQLARIAFSACGTVAEFFSELAKLAGGLQNIDSDTGLKAALQTLQHTEVTYSNTSAELAAALAASPNIEFAQYLGRELNETMKLGRYRIATAWKVLGEKQRAVTILTELLHDGVYQEFELKLRAEAAELLTELGEFSAAQEILRQF
ncbi:hypothetical protein [Canibacter zhoujuaniae]|uniref:hypothetical protein n=1 Tax=Canibacter zhoujuaniae TaxID=2708343 RepID=UPI00142132E8|nr:hypothetical protein [Canibacter zhoujuaniae]